MVPRPRHGHHPLERLRGTGRDVPHPGRGRGRTPTPLREREIPLILQDRNLDTDEDGRLTGRLLHKTLVVGTDPQGKNVALPFSGPYTLVNGTIWPYADVEARWYRFRLLNAANARTFTLRLVDDRTGAPVTGAVHQIGSDGGLLPRPLPVDGGLSVAPAERMDLLIDFGRLRGRTLRLVNDEPGVRYPQVMQFRVAKEKSVDPFVLPSVLSSSFERLTHDNVPPHQHRLVVLTPPGPLGNGHPEMWEMQEVERDTVTIPGDGVIQVKGAGGTVRTYRRGVRMLDDALGFMVRYGDWEQWSFLNLGGAGMHPMHIHLIDFQVLSRDIYPADPQSPFDKELGGTLAPLEYGGRAPTAPCDQGWKDVIQVPPGQMVNVIGQFRGARGRFHVLLPSSGARRHGDDAALRGHAAGGAGVSSPSAGRRPRSRPRRSLSRHSRAAVSARSTRPASG